MNNITKQFQIEVEIGGKKEIYNVEALTEEQAIKIAEKKAIEKFEKEEFEKFEKKLN